MNFVDTHCHIHFPDYELDPEQVIKDAQKDGVTQLLCVGCTLLDSKLAIEMAKRHDNIWATIGLHPHEGAVYVNDHIALQQFHELASQPKVVAVGECGLDYHYMHSSKEDQKKLLKFQLDLAQEHNLPLIFHIREAPQQNLEARNRGIPPLIASGFETGQAFDDFWQIFDTYKNIKGVVHSFSANQKELDEVLSRGLYVGVNGIMTFTKDAMQLKAVKTIPLQKLLLETDAPFLTPVPFRGTICEPKHVKVTAEFLSNLRGEPLEQLATATTHNARQLFNLT